MKTCRVGMDCFPSDRTGSSFGAYTTSGNCLKSRLRGPGIADQSLRAGGGVEPDADRLGGEGGEDLSDSVALVSAMLSMTEPRCTDNSLDVLSAASCCAAPCRGSRNESNR